MALLRNIPSLIVLLMVSMIAASQPESLTQTAQPLRSFADRQDKFNGNYNEAMDNLNGGSSKRYRPYDPSDSDSYYRSPISSNRARQPNNPSRLQQYEESVDYDVGVNRNGDPAYYSNDPVNPSGYVQSAALTPASK